MKLEKRKNVAELLIWIHSGLEYMEGFWDLKFEKLYLILFNWISQAYLTRWRVCVCVCVCKHMCVKSVSLLSHVWLFAQVI